MVIWADATIAWETADNVRVILSLLDLDTLEGSCSVAWQGGCPVAEGMCVWSQKFRGKAALPRPLLGCGGLRSQLLDHDEAALSECLRRPRQIRGQPAHCRVCVSPFCRGACVCPSPRCTLRNTCLSRRGHMEMPFSVMDFPP